jgi:hypothetical protein
MNVYPYKQVSSGKFTKWIIGITYDGMVLVQHQVKGKTKRNLLFKTQKSIKESELPKNIKESAVWAAYEAKSLTRGIE